MKPLPSDLGALRAGGKAALARALSALETAPDDPDLVALLDAGVVDQEALERLAALHGLEDKWTSFKRRFLDE